MVNKLRALAIIALCLPLLGAWPNTGKVYPTAVTNYVGPADVVAGAMAWWGMRAYSNTLANAGISTTPVADVLGNSTVTSCTIYLKGTGPGGVDVGTAGPGGIGHQCLGGATTFCSVTNTSCSISKLYDQTGGTNCSGNPCHLANATAANQPLLVLSQLNAQPAINCPAGSSQWLTSANALTTILQPYTVTSVVESTNMVYADSGLILFTTVNSYQFGFITNNFRQYASSVQTVGASVNTPYAAQAVFNGASSSIVINGSATGTSPGGGSFSGSLGTCNASATGFQLQGFLTEIGLWSSAFNATQYGNMNSNMRTYWAF